MRAVAISLLLLSIQNFVSSNSDEKISQWLKSLAINDTSVVSFFDMDDMENSSLFLPNADTDEEIILDPILNPGNGTDNDIDLNPEPGNGYKPCYIANGITAFCVLYFQCNSENHDMPVSTACGTYEYCCEERNIKQPSADSDHTTHQVENTTPQVEIGSPDEDAEITCGWSDHSLSNTLSPMQSGAHFGEFPWMVAVMLKQANSQEWQQDDYLGGGALIHPSVVMTVAHKVNNRTDPLKCRAGEWDTQTTQEKFPFQERDVKEVIIHTEYFRPSLYNDVALLFLERRFDLYNAPHIGVACLGQAMPSPGITCFSMGWGKYKSKKNSYPYILKKIQMKLVSSDGCQSILSKTPRLGQFFKLHESLTCAGGEEQDSCGGDGGSPLVCPILSQSTAGKTRYVVYGMVAYGIGRCGTRGVPGVYVKVPHVYGWVQQQMKERDYVVFEVDEEV